MDEHIIIKIPKELTLLSVDDIYRSVLIQRKELGVILDFADVSFVTPQSLVLAVTASRYLRDRYIRPVKWRNVQPEVLGYMDRMNISELDFIIIERPSILKRRNYKTSNALVELSIIQSDLQIGTAIRKTRDVLDRWFSEKDCKLHLLTLIKETVENCVDHSASEPTKGFCYYALQKYSRADGSAEVQIAVGDIGVGMLASQRRSFPSTKDDAEALVEAVMKGRSSRKSGGGMGYANVRDALAPLYGRIFVRSGRAHIEYAAGASLARIYRHNCICPGTQIIFKCRA